MKDIKKCFGSKACGWTEDGHYECYCYSNEELGDPPDKLTRIYEIATRAIANPDQGEQIIEFSNILKIIEEK